MIRQIIWNEKKNVTFLGMKLNFWTTVIIIIIVVVVVVVVRTQFGSKSQKIDEFRLKGPNTMNL